jgi:uncharacterized protein
MPRWLKLLLFSLAVLTIALFFFVRSLERMMTFRPAGYDGRAEWTPPPNVTERWITAADGTKLHSWWFAPKSTPKATLLFHHGNGGNLTSVAALGADMSARGYIVVLWDYRGYGRSEGSLAGDEATFFSDGDRVFAQAAAAGLPVMVWGHSLGSTVAADLCARHPCAALVMESGLASTYHFARTQVTWLPTWLHVLAKFSLDSASKLGRVRAPILIAHGREDRTIRYEHAELLYQAAPPTARALLTVDQGTHWLPSSAGYWDRVADFLGRVKTN